MVSGIGCISASTQFSVRIRVFFFLLFISLATSSSAFGADSTTAGVVTASSVGTDSIRVTMPYTGDADADNSCAVAWKPCSDTVWPPGNVINGTHSASPFLITITGLATGACYDISATYNDVDGVSGKNPQAVRISAGWDNTALHNSNRFPGSTKWQGGGWGTPGTKYGQITCATCHLEGDPNIKLIRSGIASPNLPTDSFPGQTGGTSVSFQSTTSPDGFGDDTGGHAASQKICEHCHSQTSYHRYNTAGQTDLGHNSNTDCIACHLHSLGFKDSVSCDSCHGAPPGSGSDTNAPPVYAAFHAKHYDPAAGGVPTNYASTSIRSTSSAYVFDCGNCHSNNSANHLANQDGTVDVQIPPGGTYTPGSYAGGDNPQPPGKVTFKNSAGTCANAYCHGNYPGSGLNASPTVGNSASAACGTCHGAKNTYTTNMASIMVTNDTPASGSHRKHVGNLFVYVPTSHNDQYTYDREYSCTLCHNGEIGGSGPASYSIIDKSKHANSFIDVSLDNGDYRAAGGGYSIPGATAAPSDGSTRAYGTCANVYCHSNAQTNNGTGPPSYNTIQWGSEITCNTGFCHAVGDHSRDIATGSHAKHTTNKYGGGALNSGERSCKVCHNWQNDGESCSSCHDTPGEKTLHVNGTVDVLFYTSFTGTGATYNDNTATPGLPGNGYFTCSSVYCHSPGTKAAAPLDPPNGSSPLWGSGQLDATCTGCHKGDASLPSGNRMQTGSHSKHIAVTDCRNCHNATASNSRTLAASGPINHVNKLVDIQFSSTIATGGTYKLADAMAAPVQVTPGTQPFGSCANIICHSDGKGSFAATPAWGSGPIGCSGCHGFPPNTAAHAAHIQNSALLTQAYGNTEVASNAAGYAFGCGNCHPAGEASHRNGTVDISLNPADGGALKSRNVNPATSGSGSTLQCSGVYCHSNGMASPAFALTPQWGGAFQAGSCNGCHGNSPNSAGQPAGSPAHGKHVVGIHYKTIYSGTYGLSTAGTGSGNSHGNADSSTTINCNVCHYNTVASSGNDLNAVCLTCHDGTQASLKGSAAIADKSFHVNGTPDVAFQPVAVKSKAQLRDDITTVTDLNAAWSRQADSYKSGATPFDTARNQLNTASQWTAGTKTCSVVSCHNGNSASWNGTVDCGSCHTMLPR